MNEKYSIQVKQGYKILPPKSGKAYSILCEEWDNLKKDIETITEKLNIYITQ